MPARGRCDGFAARRSAWAHHHPPHASIALDTAPSHFDGMLVIVRYAAFYCEENVWWLAQEARFAGTGCDVLVITNEHRSVATFAMRAAGRLDRCVGWDYHVVLVARGEVWDLDCLAGMPLALDAWVDACFG